MSQENKYRTPNVFVVHNPVAGTSNPGEVRAAIEGILDSSDIKYEIYETTGQEDVRQIVENALQQGYQRVWAAGGDGTVSAVANGLVNKNIPMGIIPTGTGNVLAKELDIPLDITSACNLLISDHQTRVLDVLKVSDYYFVLSVSVGIGSFTMAQTARQQKRRLGQFAYLVNGVRIILSNSLWPFKVLVDGLHFSIRATEILAANAGIIGYKPIRLGTQIRPDDGEINLCHVRLESISSIFSLISGVLFNRHDRIEELACETANDFIEISSRRRIPVQGDGEYIGYTPVRIEIISKSLPIIVPS